MTAINDIDLPAVLADRLTNSSPDVLREMLALFIHTLMGAEADALPGAGYGQRSAERTNSRNGYRNRRFDTRPWSKDRPDEDRSTPLEARTRRFRGRHDQCRDQSKWWN